MICERCGIDDMIHEKIKYDNVEMVGVNDDHTIQLSIQLADRVIALCDEAEESK